ncbi:hypothetical protein BC833DRAFT_655159 [Globomyces pollinis-pini]|nr:hypothetical protein BC833DRAFT_655159 [Globomyces pollinis-pini]
MEQSRLKKQARYFVHVFLAKDEFVKDPDLTSYPLWWIRKSSSYYFLISFVKNEMKRLDWFVTAKIQRLLTFMKYADVGKLQTVDELEQSLQMRLSTHGWKVLIRKVVMLIIQLNVIQCFITLVEPNCNYCSDGWQLLSRAKSNLLSFRMDLIFQKFTPFQPIIFKQASASPLMYKRPAFLSVFSAKILIGNRTNYVVAGSGPSLNRQYLMDLNLNQASLRQPLDVSKARTSLGILY